MPTWPRCPRQKKRNDALPARASPARPRRLMLRSDRPRLPRSAESDTLFFKVRFLQASRERERTAMAIAVPNTIAPLRKAVSSGS